MEEKYIDFKSLSSKEQMATLEEKLKKITSKIYSERQAEIISGDLEIVDIAYNITDSNQIIYDVTLMDKSKNETHEFYNDDLSRIELSQDKIDTLKSLNTDTSEMEKKLHELNVLKDSPNKVSLSALQENEKDAQKTAQSLGIDEKEIVYSATIGNNSKPKIKSDSIKGIKSDNIDASNKVTTHYNMRDIIGGNYVEYKIIKSTNGSPMVLGITDDGSAEIIDDSKLEFVKGLKSMSLMRDDGSVKNVGVVTAFRIKDSGSSLNREQIIGLSSDQGNINGFYARGETTSDEIIGEEIPAKVYSTNRVKQKEMLDTRSNPDISGEASSANARTEDGCITNSTKINNENDLEELAETYAIVYRIPKEELLQKTIENLKDHTAEGNDKDDEEVVMETAEEMQDDYKKDDERDLGDHGDGSPDEHGERTHTPPTGLV